MHARMLKRIIRACHVGGRDNLGNTFEENYGKVRASMSVALQRANAVILLQFRLLFAPL